jgi:alanyl-tRNA synthetase
LNTTTNYILFTFFNIFHLFQIFFLFKYFYVWKGWNCRKVCLRKIALDLKSKSSNSVVVLVSVVEGKAVLVAAVSDGAKAAGVKAGALVKIGSTVLGGGGGGKDDFAQGGGTNLGQIPVALSAITDAISGK